MSVFPPGPLNPAGPAQSDYLIHFCGRAPGLKFTEQVPGWIQSSSPAQRLDNILWEQSIRGFPPFGAESPMVCFSESPAKHLEWLINERHWPAWGVMVTREWVYQSGGGPAWYARPDQYAALTNSQRAWSVRLGTEWGQPRSEWLHDREWRLPVSAGSPSLYLTPGVVRVVLVADPRWQPSIRTVQQPTGYFINAVTGQYAQPDDPLAQPETRAVTGYPPLWEGLMRVYWDGNAGQFAAVVLASRAALVARLISSGSA
jgi:hypothetical protein